MRPLTPTLIVLALAAGCSERPSPSQERAAVQAKMRAECRFVGEWRATRKDADYTVVLEKGGMFHARPNADSKGVELTGRWGLVDGKMAWTYDQMPTKRPELNPIEEITPDVFDLVEDDKSKTHYVRATERPDC